MRLSPNHGGCWFCCDDFGVLYFTTEFDAFFHKECLIEVLKKEPRHDEAVLIKCEFPEWFKDEPASEKE